jgi:hypothetical protein
MKRHSVILPFDLPRLTDKAAAQLIELLHELFAGIEHHYAEQAFRYNKRQLEIRLQRQSPPSDQTNTPF